MNCDKEIIDVVAKLNEYGFKTTESCYGGKKHPSKPYVVFRCDYNSALTLITSIHDNNTAMQWIMRLIPGETTKWGLYSEVTGSKRLWVQVRNGLHVRLLQVPFP